MQNRLMSIDREMTNEGEGLVQKIRPYHDNTLFSPNKHLPGADSPNEATLLC